MANFYTPIDSAQKYDRKEFVSAYSDFSDLESYVQALEKDPHDPSTISDLGGLLHGASNFYENMRNPASAARVGSNEAYSDGVENMALYVKGNFEEFFKLLDDEGVVNLVTSLPLYKTDKDEHNKFVEGLNELKEMEEIKKDPKKLRAYVQEKIKKAPKWVQKELSYFAGDHDYVSALYSVFAQEVQIEFSKKLQDKDGKIRRTFLEGIVRDSLDKAWKEQIDETNDKDKNDIWKADIRPYYLALAQMAYPKEKKDEKYDKDSEREKRKAERRAIGMRK